MSDRMKVYRAHLGNEVGPNNGHSTFVVTGLLTECGEWVDGSSVRWPMSSDWSQSQPEALARLAPQIAAIGSRLLTQAVELMAAAKEHA